MSSSTEHHRSEEADSPRGLHRGASGASTGPEGSGPTPAGDDTRLLFTTTATEDEMLVAEPSAIDTLGLLPVGTVITPYTYPGALFPSVVTGVKRSEWFQRLLLLKEEGDEDAVAGWIESLPGLVTTTPVHPYADMDATTPKWLLRVETEAAENPLWQNMLASILAAWEAGDAIPIGVEEGDRHWADYPHDESEVCTSESDIRWYRMTGEGGRRPLTTQEREAAIDREVADVLNGLLDQVAPQVEAPPPPLPPLDGTYALPVKTSFLVPEGETGPQDFVPIISTHNNLVAREYKPLESVAISSRVLPKFYTLPPWIQRTARYHHNPESIEDVHYVSQVGESNQYYLRRMMQFSLCRWPERDPSLWSKGKVLEVAVRLFPTRMDVEREDGASMFHQGESVQAALHVDTTVLPVSQRGVLVPLRRGRRTCKGVAGCPLHADYFDIRAVGMDYCYKCAKGREFAFLDYHSYLPYQLQELFYEWPQWIGLRGNLGGYKGLQLNELRLMDPSDPSSMGNEPIENGVPMIRHILPAPMLGVPCKDMCIKCREAKATWGIVPAGSYLDMPIARYCKPCAVATSQTMGDTVRARYAMKKVRVTLKKAVMALFEQAGRTRLLNGQCAIREGERCRHVAVGRKAVFKIVDTSDASVTPTGKLVCEDPACLKAALTIIPPPLGIVTGEGSGVRVGTGFLEEE